MKNIMEGLKIFLKYDPDAQCSASHDVLYAQGPHPNDSFTITEDVEKLKRLHWRWDSTTESWAHFT